MPPSLAPMRHRDVPRPATRARGESVVRLAWNGNYCTRSKQQQRAARQSSWSMFTKLTRQRMSHSIGTSMTSLVHAHSFATGLAPARCARVATRASSTPPPEADRPRATRRAVFRAAFAATLSSLLVPQARALDAEAGALTFASLTTPGAGPSRVIADLASSITPGAEVYFGNGCFWGRQHEFVQTERLVLGRTDDEVSSVVGYAGGVRTPQSGKEDDKVCYYYGAPGTVYERLGHGEVVRTVLSDKSPERAASDLSAFAKTYFANFKKVVGFGMQRLDPQDSGAGYRNMIGLPGGINSPFMAIIAEENTNQMKLKQGAGNAANEKPKEDDVFNAVWIYDTDKVRVGAFPNPTHTVSAASGRVHY